MYVHYTDFYKKKMQIINFTKSLSLNLKTDYLTFEKLTKNW